jgi:hypothetical protein
MVDRFNKRTAADDDYEDSDMCHYPTGNTSTIRDLVAKRRSIGPAWGVRQWITLAASKKQEFMTEFNEKGREMFKFALSSQVYPYEYMSHLGGQHMLAYILFTVEILNLEGHVRILERNTPFEKPLRFEILDPEGCKGKFDTIFSMNTEECLYAPVHSSSIQNECSAAETGTTTRGTLFRYSYPSPARMDEDLSSASSHGEMVWFNKEGPSLCWCWS